MIIAIGKSRKDTRWHNTEMSWPEFLNRLMSAYRSHETVKEYKAMSKDEKGRAKDIGGFVGGELSSGRRKAENVVNRCMVTLDLDIQNDNILGNLPHYVEQAAREGLLGDDYEEEDE